LEKLFGVIFSLYKGMPGHGDLVVACLQGAWPKLVGDGLAKMCKPAWFGESTLVIEALDQQLEKAIRSVQPALLEKLRSATGGEVRKIIVSRRSSVASGASALDCDIRKPVSNQQLRPIIRD
jgi:hypothetical protein